MKTSIAQNSEFYHSLIDQILSLKNPNIKQINSLKIKLAKEFKFNSVVKNPQILGFARDDEERAKLVEIFNTKPIREASGVTVVALFAKPHSCPHGKCMYCPGGPGSPFGDTPQSYTGQEPAALRAKRNMYDPYLQIFNRLEHYVANGHDPDKLELIFMGGTFPSLDQEYRDQFVKYVYKAINDFGELFFQMRDGKRIIKYDVFNEFFEMTTDFSSQQRQINVQEKMFEQKLKSDELSMDDQITKNETAIIRAIGLTVETKPDWALQSHCADMLRYGCTRLEIGVQTLNENCLKKTNRGHNLQDTKDCFQVAKDMCFKINAHMMLGLPASTLETDEEGLIGLFEQEFYRPDMLKIYPCLVVVGTPLYNMYKMGKFEPIKTQKAAEIIARAYSKFPRYVRVMRVQRDIPTTLVEGGVQKSNLRQYVEEEMRKNNTQSKDIRAREIGLRQLEEIENQKKIRLDYEDDEVIAVNISIPIKGKLKEISQKLYDNDSSEYSNEKLPYIPHITLSMKALKKSQLTKLIKKLQQFQFKTFKLKTQGFKKGFLTFIDVEKNILLNDLQNKILNITSEFENQELTNNSFLRSNEYLFDKNIMWLENYSKFDTAHISLGENIDEKAKEIFTEDIQFDFESILISQMGNYCSARKEICEINIVQNHEKNEFNISVEEFDASLGKEFFIDVVNKEDTLIGFIRLRLPHQTNLMPEIDESTALIRELHIYGQTIPVGAESSAAQHKGWGTKLVKKCEEIAQENGYKKIAIISGVGVREYYRKLGYEKEGPYMCKHL